MRRRRRRRRQRRSVAGVRCTMHGIPIIPVRCPHQSAPSGLLCNAQFV